MNLNMYVTFNGVYLVISRRCAVIWRANSRVGVKIRAARAFEWERLDKYKKLF